MPFTYPLGHPFSFYYYAAQYGSNFTDFGFTYLFLGSGYADELTGDSGADTMHGLRSTDTLRGEGGADVLFGGIHDDRLYGGSGVDLLFGGDDDDDLFGGAQTDVLHGDAGRDALYGGLSNDVLFGGVGNDALFGNSGQDVLFGGDGNDLIDGGPNTGGADTLTGDGGDDRFGFWSGSSGARGNDIDRITDFDQNGDDVMQFDVTGVGAFTATQNTGQPQLGDGTFVTVFGSFGQEYQVFLENVVATSVTADDFVFI